LGVGNCYDYLYEHLRTQGGEVCLSVTDEILMASYRKDPELHRRRMKELCGAGKVSFRILAKKSNFRSAYAQYRWQPDQSPQPTAFYAFGDCVALISFVANPAPHVIVIKSAPLAASYRYSFNIAWEQAEEPPRGKGTS
jgi:hypothetical protein